MAADTFTTNLGLRTQGTGNNENTWGTKLNTDVIDTLDLAVAGRLSKSVAGSSDVTLTTTLAGEWMNAIHEYNGTLTGNINVIWPDTLTRKILVFNNTSGAYTLTVKTTSGSGVAVPQGSHLLLYSNGTNVVNAKSAVGQALDTVMSSTATAAAQRAALELDTGDSPTFTDLTLSGAPAFLAYRSSSSVTIATGATTKITFNSELFDTGADYDSATNHRFIAPVAGRYAFQCAVQLSGMGTTDNTRLSCYIYKNNALVVELVRLTTPASMDWATDLFTEISIGGACVLDLAVNDYVEVFVYQNTGATVNTNYGAGASVYFSGYRVA